MSFKPRRRPSPALIIATGALFLSLGGVGLAAPGLLKIGTKQIKNGAVTNAKLHKGAVTAGKVKPGAIGSNQINSSQVQARVSGTCTGTTGAIGSISSSGGVTCNPTAPSAFSAPIGSVEIGLTSTPIADLNLPAGSFVVNADQWLEDTSPGGGDSTTTCTLTLGAQSDVSELGLLKPADTPSNIGTMGLTVAGTLTAPGEATLSCLTGPGETFVEAGALNAVQVGSVTG
jgi:hypothetical protein